VLARVLNALGRTFIGAGLLMLLFVGYQLWGTGLHEARAQDKLDRQFTERLADEEPTGASVTTTTAPTASVPTTTAPAGAPPTSTTLVGEATDPDRVAPVDVQPGEAIARIQIPEIGVDKLVVEGVTVDDLRKGPGHYRSTPQPGYPGNAAIAGHRTTYGAPFSRIDELVPGDKIMVTTLHGTWTYIVAAAPDDPTSGHFIVKPEEVWVLNDFGDNRLTLTACHPKFSADQRIVVVAKLVEAPATPPTTTAPAATAHDAATGVTGPAAAAVSGATGAGSGQIVGHDQGAAVSPDDPSLDEGLGGDPGARTPALLWGLVFLALLAGSWQLSIRWRRWPAYAIAVIPMVIVLFSWFEQLDRWMPAR
jgi:sortase A